MNGNHGAITRDRQHAEPAQHELRQAPDREERHDRRDGAVPEGVERDAVVCRAAARPLKMVLSAMPVLMSRTGTNSQRAATLVAAILRRRASCAIAPAPRGHGVHAPVSPNPMAELLPALGGHDLPTLIPTLAHVEPHAHAVPGPRRGSGTGPASRAPARRSARGQPKSGGSSQFQSCLTISPPMQDEQRHPQRSPAGAIQISLFSLVSCSAPHASCQVRRECSCSRSRRCSTA